MSAGFSLDLRRQAGPEPRFAVRYACRNGRAVLAAGAVWSVAEASLRSNGHLEGMSAQQVMEGVFVFVGFELADNAKFQLWHLDAAALLALPPGSPWTAVSPKPVERSPFFSLDTDELEFDRPWSSRRGRPRPVPERVTEPGAVRSRWQPSVASGSTLARSGAVSQPSPSTSSGFFDVPGLVEPMVEVEPSSAWSRWDEREVVALPGAGLAEHTRIIDAPGGGVSDLLRVVNYLREELRAERVESRRLQARVAELRATVAALAQQSKRS